MLSTFLRLSLLSLPLAWAEHQPHSFSKRHHDISKRLPDTLEKRSSFTNARWTFYSTGLGACGDTNTDSDFIVALNTPQYTEFGTGYPGPECNKQITMTYNGKTTTATIKDECPGCGWGQLDLAPGLFSFFADQSEGEIFGTWWFNDGSGGGNSDPTTTTTQKKTTTHTTPAYTPPSTTSTTPAYTPPSTTSTTHSKTTETSTSTTPTSTSTSKTSTSKTSTSHSSSSAASSSSSSSSSSVASSTITSSQSFSNSAASALAVATGTLSGSSSSSTGAASNLNDYAEAVLGMAGMVVQGGML